jgi:hypothetical protein
MYIQKADNGTGSRPWALIANSSSFYFFTYWHSGYPTDAEGYFFGDILAPGPDAYRCALVSSWSYSVLPGGNGPNINNFYIISPTYVSGSGRLLARKLGSSSPGNVRFLYTGSSSTINNLMGADNTFNKVYPNIGGSVALSRLRIFQDDTPVSNDPFVLRGYMPGLFAPLHYQKPDNLTIVSNVPDADGHDILAIKLRCSNSSDSARAVIDITGPWEYPGLLNSGTYGISGVVTEDFVPGAYRVFLFRESDGVLVRTTWSNSEGAYAFTDLSIDTYIVMLVDHTSPIKSPSSKSGVVPS